MLDELDRIEWDKLSHAYGSAGDVPGLLRELATAPPSTGNDSPLYELFGNILHQGTVYEATSYAVPFLIELAANPSTPDRIGILDLLSAFVNAVSDDGGDSVRKCRAAVEKQLGELVTLTKESGTVRLAAAHFLAQFSEHVEVIGPVIRDLLVEELSDIHRSGLLLLLGQVGDFSPAALSALSLAIDTGSDVERLASSISLAKLNQPLPTQAIESLQEAILNEDLEGAFEELPWYEPVDMEELLTFVDTSGGQEQLLSTVMKRLETDQAEHRDVEVMLLILFPTPVTQTLTSDSLSTIQRKALVLLHKALGRAIKQNRRLFYSYLPHWGIPDTRREQAALLEGRADVVDERAPLIALERTPGKRASAGELVAGTRVIHRYFGAGTVVTGNGGNIAIYFDEEGHRTVSL